MRERLEEVQRSQIDSSKIILPEQSLNIHFSGFQYINIFTDKRAHDHNFIVFCFPEIE